MNLTKTLHAVGHVSGVCHVGMLALASADDD
jgi:hypothetical protein